ncbi:Glycosyltransferase involved in cell wall bisynthesis [Anaerovirgula multivorans]|uniref:Glycosyltransferase involved in cell wall bisynthesis n=1 Tax=Anaerovirgula multivorans TaxID=312168 RepID=A0A238ZVK3_9FIRM|nr:glycosyltransferase family 2 protein [Anaerovirgula multivorans]SNR87041.1 Glycosyltransferase involved in cell wall bisynthesis [Anaerovirgula multivorans]
MYKNVSVIIPAFNEEKRIVNTLLAVKEVDFISKIFVVDDGSIDQTVEQALTVENIIVIKNKENKGKGHALKVGVEAAIEDSDILVFLDADLQESAKEATKLIEPLINDVADVTIAKFPPSKKKGGFGLVKNLAKYGVFLNTGVKLHTVLSGQRAFKKKVLQNIHLDYEGYAIELGMTIDIIKKGFVIKEIEVEMFHNETERNLSGFYHRGKQFYHIFKSLLGRRIR